MRSWLGSIVEDGLADLGPSSLASLTELRTELRAARLPRLAGMLGTTVGHLEAVSRRDDGTDDATVLESIARAWALSVAVEDSFPDALTGRSADTSGGELELFVTDSFMADFRTMTLPPMAELAGRVKRFQVRIEDGGKLETRLLGQFGDTGAAGALRMVESIAGDPAHGRLLIAEEDRRVGSTLRDYTLAGHYNGRSLATFDADAEGIALWACSAEDGYWVAVDQLTPTRFRVFDRATLAPAGVFSGKVTSNTDGETVYAMPTPRFPAGALFALHNDVSLAAFDLRDIARALDLKGDCPR